MYNKFWKGLPSNRPQLDIQNPYYDLTPPIESIESIEREIKKMWGLQTRGFTMKDVKAITEIRRASLDESSEMDEDDNKQSTLCCDDCGEELGDDFHTLDGDILCQIEHICPDCYRKRYGPYKCYNCEKEFSAKEIDWDNSDKDEDSYICRDCSYNQQFGWD